MATRRLYLGNLQWGVTEDDVRDLFKKYTVLDSKIVTDRDTGKSRGFGFVTLADKKQAEAATAELDGQDFMGRTLRVREANTRPTGKREQRGNGRGRNDYGWK